MKRLIIVAALAALVASCGPNYETVKGDPLNVWLFTV